MLGAIIGDIVGSRFEFCNYRHKNFELITERSEFTDDTIMTVAVMDILNNDKINDKKTIIEKMKYYGNKYPSSYGLSFAHWLNSSNSKPYNSYGNGAAMRVSPIGWIANNEREVKKWANNVTSITHNHPEGLKGAEVTAMCVYYARIGKSKQFIKEYVEKYYNLDFDYETLRKTYRFNETCQNTVPQAIYCFLISKDFEDCLRTSISIGGDSDTLAAISCSIAEAYYKHIDTSLIKNIYKLLPQEFITIITDFNIKYGKKILTK